MSGGLLVSFSLRSGGDDVAEMMPCQVIALATAAFGIQNRSIPLKSYKEPFQAFNDIGPAKIVKKSRN